MCEQEETTQKELRQILEQKLAVLSLKIIKKCMRHFVNKI